MRTKAKSTTPKRKKLKLTTASVKDLSGRVAGRVKGGMLAKSGGQGGCYCGCLDTRCNNYSRTQYSL